MAASATSAAESEASPAPLSPEDLLLADGADEERRDPKPLDPLEPLESAERHRARGNERFQAGDVSAARHEYGEALRLLEATGRAGDPLAGDAAASVDEGAADLQQRRKACCTPVQLNLALCCLRAEPPDAFQALMLCESVLSEEPENPKATYRKAKALEELGELKEAEWELVRACRLLPKDVTVRQELEKLRQRMRSGIEREKRTYEGLFDRKPGFASAGRDDHGSATDSSEQPCGLYELLMKPEENDFRDVEHPAEEAKALQEKGQLTEAIWAIEAAITRSAQQSDWPLHYEHWTELGRLFMDLNIDFLALRCLTRVTEQQALSSAPNPPLGPEEGTHPPLPSTRQYALLLRAICLLNEGGQQVLQGLAEWLAAARPQEHEKGNRQASPLDARLADVREATDGAQLLADVAVAHGLLHLSQRHEAAPTDFATALLVPEDGSDSSCCYFSSPRRRATKWNMLGAVLANRGRHEHALIAYDQALRRQPRYPRALTNRGIALHALRRYREAAAAFTAGLTLVPAWGSKELWLLLAKASEESGDVALMEAAGSQNLTKLQEALELSAEPDGATVESTGTAQEDEKVDEVLKRIGFPPS